MVSFPHRIIAPQIAPQFIALLIAAMSSVACDNSGTQTPAPAPSTSEAPIEVVEAPKRMPEVHVTLNGVSMGYDELQFSAPSFDASLQNLIKKYPVDQPEQVILTIERKVKTQVATKVFYALADAGAKSIEVRTAPRGEFPDKLVIVPEKAVGDGILPCTYVSMVLSNFGVTFWRKQGGLAKRYSKGMAGPDLSAMHGVMHKESKLCTSRVFLFSAQQDVDWGHCFDVAGSVKAADPPYEYIDRFVLLRTDPVAGKPVTLGQ